jgi:hypothetical protein
MKSDNKWDLGTEGGQQRLLIPTAGVTAAYAEQAHKVTLNASSDIFARCSKLQTSDLSRLSDFTISRPCVIQADHEVQSVRNSSRCLLPLLDHTLALLGQERWDPTR